MTVPLLWIVTMMPGAPPGAPRKTKMRSLSLSSWMAHEAFETSSCTHVCAALRDWLFVTYATLAVGCVTSRPLIVRGPHATAVLTPVVPGIATDFVASVGVTVAPDTVHGFASIHAVPSET